MLAKWKCCAWTRTVARFSCLSLAASGRESRSLFAQITMNRSSWQCPSLQGSVTHPPRASPCSTLRSVLHTTSSLRQLLPERKGPRLGRTFRQAWSTTLSARCGQVSRGRATLIRDCFRRSLSDLRRLVRASAKGSETVRLNERQSTPRVNGIVHVDGG